MAQEAPAQRCPQGGLRPQSASLTLIRVEGGAQVWVRSPSSPGLLLCWWWRGVLLLFIIFFLNSKENEAGNPFPRGDQMSLRTNQLWGPRNRGFGDS